MTTPDFVLALRAKIGTDLLPMVGTTAIVRNRAGQVLLGRRADTGEWALPSGIVEPFEEPAAAIAREVHEETGVEVSVDALVSVSALPDPVVYANGDQAAYWDLSFSCSYVRGEPAPVDGENTEVGWFDLDRLPPLRPSSSARLATALTYTGAAWFARRGRLRR